MGLRAPRVRVVGKEALAAAVCDWQHRSSSGSPRGCFIRGLPRPASVAGAGGSGSTCTLGHVTAEHDFSLGAEGEYILSPLHLLG